MYFVSFALFSVASSIMAGFVVKMDSVAYELINSLGNQARSGAVELDPTVSVSQNHRGVG